MAQEMTPAATRVLQAMRERGSSVRVFDLRQMLRLDSMVITEALRELQRAGLVRGMNGGMRYQLSQQGERIG